MNMGWLLANWTEILAAFGGLVGSASIFVGLVAAKTANKTDDKIGRGLKRIYNGLSLLSLGNQAKKVMGPPEPPKLP